MDGIGHMVMSSHGTSTSPKRSSSVTRNASGRRTQPHSEGIDVQGSVPGESPESVSSESALSVPSESPATGGGPSSAGCWLMSSSDMTRHR